MTRAGGLGNFVGPPAITPAAKVRGFEMTSKTNEKRAGVRDPSATAHAVTPEGGKILARGLSPAMGAALVALDRGWRAAIDGTITRRTRGALDDRGLIERAGPHGDYCLTAGGRAALEAVNAAAAKRLKGLTPAMRSALATIARDGSVGNVRPQTLDGLSDRGLIDCETQNYPLLTRKGRAAAAALPADETAEPALVYPEPTPEQLKRAAEYDAKVEDCERRRRESIDRSGISDGFMSQAASATMADVYRTDADILRAGGVAVFEGLFRREDGARVAAKLICSEGQWGARWSWAFCDAAGNFTGRFISDSKGTPRSQMGREGFVKRDELAPAKGKCFGFNQAGATRTDGGYPADAVVILEGGRNRDGGDA